MSMSSSVVGVRDLDGTFAKMAAVKEACEDAEVDYPDLVKQYFKYPGEDIEYLKSEMESMDISAAVTERNEDAVNIWEVDLSKLPEGVKKIRFSNSY